MNANSDYVSRFAIRKIELQPRADRIGYEDLVTRVLDVLFLKADSISHEARSQFGVSRLSALYDALQAIDPDQHLTSERLRRAARHLAGQTEMPLTGLARGITPSSEGHRVVRAQLPCRAATRP